MARDYTALRKLGYSRKSLEQAEAARSNAFANLETPIYELEAIARLSHEKIESVILETLTTDDITENCLLSRLTKEFAVKLSADWLAKHNEAAAIERGD